MAGLAFGLSLPSPALSNDSRLIGGQPATPSSMTLYVELVVNRLPTGRIVRTELRNGAYFIRVADLDGVSLPAGVTDGELVDLSRLPDVKTEYDSAAQKFLITVPSVWLPANQIETASARNRIAASVSPGMLINYDVYASAPSRGSSQLSVWTEGRLFDSWGTLVSTGVYRKSFGEKALAGPVRDGRYLRYDTSFTYTDFDRIITYEAGDLITGALSWNTPVRLGGISVSRDFPSRPDIVTYPLPQFAGQAAVPTAVDLLINGSKVATGEVAPGPFVFNELPFVNGAGEATLVTTDALGRKVETSVPFYIANNLLRPGLWDYSVSAGAIRQGYGIRSFSYGDFALSGSARFGAAPFLTLEGHVEGARHLQLGGLGAGIRLGLNGVVNTSVALSHTQGAIGRQYSVGYSYSSQRFSLSVRHMERTADFRDLASYDIRDVAASSLMRSSTQANTSVNLGRSAGTIGAAYFEMTTVDRNRNRGANLSYMRGRPDAALMAGSMPQCSKNA